MLSTGDQLKYQFANFWLVVNGCHQVYFPINIGNNLEHQFCFPINVGFLIIPIDELIFFRGVQTTNQSRFLENGAFFAAGYNVTDFIFEDGPHAVTFCTESGWVAG